MAPIILSSLQNLKWLKLSVNLYQIYTTPSKVVFGHFYVVTGFFQNSLIKIKCVKGFMSSVKYLTGNKGLHDTEIHCGYWISFVSTETPSVTSVLDDNLAEPKGSDLKPWLSFCLG